MMPLGSRETSHTYRHWYQCRRKEKVIIVTVKANFPWCLTLPLKKRHDYWDLSHYLCHFYTKKDYFRFNKLPIWLSFANNYDREKPLLFAYIIVVLDILLYFTASNTLKDTSRWSLCLILTIPALKMASLLTLNIRKRQITCTFMPDCSKQRTFAA